jgi:membrane-bound lytic murein transglycosylase B
MRLAPIAAAMVAGMTVSAAAQFMAPGLPPPGYSQQQQQQQQQQMPPCMKDFAPLRAEAEKRGLAVKAATSQKDKAPREEVCALLKRYSEAESRIVKFIKANAVSCGIPPEAGTQMKANHDRTLKTVSQVCAVAAGPARPTGPGLSEALGTTRSGSVLDPTAPQSGTLDTLTGNVLSR